MVFSFIFTYLLRFWNWLNGQRFATMLSVSSFRGFFKQSVVKRKFSASTWRKNCYAQSARGGYMILLEHGAATTVILLCRSSCELGYLGRLAALPLAFHSGSDALCRWLSLIKLSEFLDDFHKLNCLLRWVQGVIHETRVRSISRPNIFVVCHIMEMFFIYPSSLGQLFIALPSW